MRQSALPRFGKPVGFLLGVFLGVITRDHYMYPYPLRVQDLEEDFKEFEKQTDKMENEVQKKI